MRLHSLLAVVALLDSTVSAVPQPDSSDLTSQHQHQERSDAWTSVSDLWKRKGGGGGGGRGGGGRGGSSSSGGGRGKGSSSSSTGGKTTIGSGPRPAYGGGKYYGGGGTVPYQSGKRSSGGLIPLPFLFAGLAIAFWPGIWYHPAYLYPYNQTWTYHNASSNQNETKPVLCGCDAYQECGCDDNSNSTYIDSVIGDGSLASMNQSLVTVGNVNGTDTILLNGTLPNGTTADGGTENPNSGVGISEMAHKAMYLPFIATALAVGYFC